MSAEAIEFSIGAVLDSNFLKSIKKVNQEVGSLKTSVQSAFKSMTSATKNFNLETLTVSNVLKSGTKSLDKFQKIAGQSSAVVDSLQKVFGGSNETLSKLGEGIDYVSSLAGSMKSSFKEAGAVISELKEYGVDFDVLKDHAVNAYGTIKDKGVFGAVKGWSKSAFGGMKKYASGAFSALKGGVGSAVGVLKTVLFSAFGAIKSVIVSTSTFLFTNPIGLAIMAICGLVALIFAYWEPIKEFFVQLFEPVMPVFQMVWDWIKMLAVEACAMFMSAWSPIKDFFVMLWDGIKSVFATVWEGLKLAFEWSPLGILINNWGAVKEFFTGIWDGLKSGVMYVWDILKKAFSWSPLGLIMKGFGKVFDWIGSKFEWVGSLARKAKGWFSWIPGLGDDDEEFDKNLEIEKTIKEAKSSTPAAQASKLASSPTQVNNSNTISIKAAPGQSEEAIAEAVVRKMAERDAEKQRSALYDSAAY